MLRAQDILPTYADIAEVRHGRSPREGYQRGAALKYRQLDKKIAAEADFQQAIALARNRTVVTLPRLMNLYLLVRFYIGRLPIGHIIEYGSYRGGSALFMASLAKEHLPGVEVWALDTFAGMPETDRSIDLHQSGDFKDADLREIEAVRDKSGLNNLHFVKGTFEDTAVQTLSQCRSIRLAHIDCDIYSAAAYAWDATKAHMVPGGYVVLDDATEGTCLGATEVVEERMIHRDGLRSEQIDPHFVFRYPRLHEPEGLTASPGLSRPA